MATAIEQTKREQTQASAEALAANVLARVSANAATATAIAKAAGGRIPGVDPQDFVAADRIHIKHGSLFIDSYLVLHPHELAPENEAKLRDKLRLTYSINNPSFYESAERQNIALSLGQLIPISLGARRSNLIEAVKKFNTQVDSGVDSEMQKELGDKHHPFAAIVRDTLEHPAHDPVGTEMLKNSLAMYLLVREKLTRNGYLDKLSLYAGHGYTSDQVLAVLSDKIGVSALQVREAAVKGGIDAVGQLLGLEANYVKDVKAVVEQSALQEFGYNRIEHWHLGRQLLGVDAPIEQKIAHGIEARITGKIGEFRGRVHHRYEVPEPVKAEQKRIAEALSFVEPIQRALMYKLGYEICFTPDFYADDIAKYNGIFGLHRKAANDMRDVKGTYRIYFSGRGDLKDSMRTLVHEVAHNLWPDHFSAGDVQKIDALATSDAQRFASLNRMLDEKFDAFDKFVKAYQAGNDAEKAAIVETTKEYFKPYGVSIDEGLLPYVRDARDFRFLIKHVNDTLTVEGMRYQKSNYHSAHERFREIISRFAELKQVEYRSEPQLLHFVAPGLDQVFEAHYLPHLKRVYQELEKKSVNGHPSPVAITQQGIAQPVQETPKVVERPAAVAADAVQACGAEGIPRTQVEKTGLEINPLTMAAQSVLTTMGVAAR